MEIFYKFQNRLKEINDLIPFKLNILITSVLHDERSTFTPYSLYFISILVTFYLLKNFIFYSSYTYILLFYFTILLNP